MIIKLMFLDWIIWHNYILYLERFGAQAVRLLTHKEMYRSHNLNIDGISDS